MKKQYSYIRTECNKATRDSRRGQYLIKYCVLSTNVELAGCVS